MSEIIALAFKPGERSLEWIFEDPDTSFKYRANSRAELTKLIILYRANNRLDPIEELDQVLDNYLCRLDCNSGKCRVFPLLKRSLAGYYKGAVLLLKSLWYKTTVSQEEADARSSTCKDCKFNIFPDKRGFVRWSDALAEATVGKKRSKYHNELGNCSICTCCMKPKVWISKDNLELPKEQVDQMPDWCWQRLEILEKKNGI